jgi:hypothetical protein
LIKDEERMRLRVFLLPLCLMGCVEPMVSDFNGSSVKIVEDFGARTPTPATVAEAQRICGKVGKTSEYASTRNLQNYQTEYLFLCL